MVDPTPAAMPWTSERYFGLAREGVLGPDDRVELLEGLIVGVAPQDPAHAVAVAKVADALRDAIGRRAAVRVQLPLHAGTRSVPEPDVAVVAGRHDDYAAAHPRRALLVVEVADRSLAQDRLTKAAIYAAAGVPAYWIVNLRDDCVERMRRPDPRGRRYLKREILHRGDVVALELAPGDVAVDDLLPER